MLGFRSDYLRLIYLGNEYICCVLTKSNRTTEQNSILHEMYTSIRMLQI